MGMRFRQVLFVLGVTALVVGGAAACSSDDGDAASPDESSTTTATDGPAGEPDGAVSDAFAQRLEGIRGANEIEGPITGGKYGIAYLAMPEGWDEDYGYTEEEYFLRGDAVGYGTAGELAVDGRWEAIGTSATQPYATRIVVRRPADAADFNGTVVVEWLNVSAGRESDPDFGFLAEELLGEGYAYVSVSAQRTGIEPGGLGIEIPNVAPEALAPLKEWDPERYGALSHPGDTWSYDIFTQATRTALETGEGTPLGDLQVERAIAVGESQSAFRMVTYVNAIQPVTELFDGFLVHSRNGSAAALNDQPDAPKPPDGAQIRTDTKVPVFQFQTETDLDFLNFTPARQDDTDKNVTWEAAGTAHADESTLAYARLAGAQWTDASVDFSSTCGTTNNGPGKPIVQTAFAALHDWIIDGTQPPESPRIEVGDDGEIVRDQDGIALGGIRTPAVDVPISVLSGANNSEAIICVLFGSEAPFTPEELTARYGDQSSYVGQVEASAQAAVDSGYLLPRHADEIITAAGEVDFG